MSIANSERRYDVALLLVVLIWGLNFPIIKVPLEAMPPFTVNLFRFAVSIVTLGVLWYWRARALGQSFFAPITKYPWSILALGLTGHLGYQILFILGIDRTVAGNAALIIASSPAWTALISHVSRIEQLRADQWLGLALSFLGVLVVVLTGGREVDFSPATLTGNLMLLVGSAFWALYTVMSRPILQRGVAPLGLTFFSVLVAMPVLAGLGLYTLPDTQWAHVNGWTWLALLFSGGLSTGIAYLLWNLAVNHVGPSQTAIFSNLVPFVALVAAFVILGDPITPLQIGGGILIVGGLVLMRR